MDDVELRSTEVLYQGFNRLLLLHIRHRRFVGGWSPVLDREVFVRANAAALLPYDPIRDEVALLEQFRPGAYVAGRNCWQLEPVAGIIGADEMPEDVVRREAREEAGCEPLDLESMGLYLVSPGCASETVDCYCGRIDSSKISGVHGRSDEGEDIRVHVLGFDEVRMGLAANRFQYALTLICLQWLVLNRDRLHDAWAAGQSPA